MSENYIVINGKRAELTEEQLRQLGIKTENPFKRAMFRQYFTICGTTEIACATDYGYASNNRRFEVANYCTDEAIMKQRILHETINRLLWRYSMEYGGSEIDETSFGAIKLRNNKVEAFKAVSPRVGEIRFASREIAENAIKEIIEPFMKEHSEFKW